MTKLNDRQIEKLREAYGIASKIDEEYDWTGTFMGARDKVRDFAFERGMTHAEVFRELMAPHMNPVLVNALAFGEEAVTNLSLGTVPAAARYFGIMDDKKFTEGVTTGEFSVPLPESLQGGFLEEALTNVSPARVAGGLVGGGILAKGGQKLMQKAFDMSTGLARARTAAGPTIVSAEKAFQANVPASVTGKLSQFATNPRVIAASEMGLGVGALEAPAEMIRSSLSGEDITSDKVVEAMAIGVATGLAFDTFFSLLPKAIELRVTKW